MCWWCKIWMLFPILMIYILLSFLLSFFLRFLFWFISFILGKRRFLDFEKNSSFECGFDPILSARVPFSIQFFLLAVLFLIFDVEIVLLLPIPLVLFISSWENGLIFCFFFLLILFLGLFHEWKEGTLNWIF